MQIMAMLRDKEHGCPWDRKQTFSSIAPHTLEEAYEVVDTIEREDYSHLANELGDLLFQIVFYAQLGKEQGLFDFDAIVVEIGNKLLSRHPHVFPEGTMESFGAEESLSPDQVEGNWEKIKQTEREGRAQEPASVLDDIPKALPSLTRARKIQKRAANVGFDWPDQEGAFAKIHEETGELREALQGPRIEQVEEELGDLLFSMVNLARHLKIEPESCLRKANDKFERRFRNMESRASKNGISMGTLSLEALESYWQAAKQEE